MQRAAWGGLARDILARDYLGDGKFAKDEGDATAWALVHHAACHRAGVTDPLAGVVGDVLARERRLIDRFPRSLAEAEEAGLGLLGLIAIAEQFPDARDGRRIALGLRVGNAAALAQGGVIERPRARFDPTGVTACLAYGNLRWGAHAQRADLQREGARLLERLRERRLGADGLYWGQAGRLAQAHSNVLVVCALARAGALDEARGLYRRAQAALRDPSSGLWRASMEEEAAFDLSTQAYALMAALEAGLDSDFDELLEEITQNFWNHDVLARESDPKGGPSSAYCPGCNLQVAALALLREADAAPR